MRVRVNLNALDRDTELPLNYQHAVASLIYSALSLGSTTFAAKLHDVGFRSNGRTFKLFTFFRLQIQRARLRDDRLTLDDPQVSVLIGSPVEEFVENLIAGFSYGRDLRIAEARFELSTIERLVPPLFQEQMKFFALSPITETTNGEWEHPTFLSLGDNWSEPIRNNLIEKHRILHGRPPEDIHLDWKWDWNYVKRPKSEVRVCRC